MKDSTLDEGTLPSILKFVGMNLPPKATVELVIDGTVVKGGSINSKGVLVFEYELPNLDRMRELRGLVGHSSKWSVNSYPNPLFYFGWSNSPSLNVNGPFVKHELTVRLRE